MSTDINDKAAVEKRLWQEITDSRFGMLAAVERTTDHFQPMTAFVEPEAGKIWFYTRQDSDLAQEAHDGVEAMFVFVSKDQSVQASIRGELRAGLDVLHRDKFWSAAVSAWFPGGKEDPQLTMLSLACEDAQVWITDTGGLRFGWEIAKANMTGSTPDLGGKTELQLG